MTGAGKPVVWKLCCHCAVSAAATAMVKPLKPVAVWEKPECSKICYDSPDFSSLVPSIAMLFWIA